MYLLKKIVNFGSGRASNDTSGEEDHSRPETPIEAPGDDDESDYLGRQGKKKRGRSKKKKKSEKFEEKQARMIKKDDDTEDGDMKDPEEPVPRHEIPDIFFEDLSETDKSKEGNSTSQDVSSSDLSECLPPERPGQDVDIWADRNDDDFVERKKSLDDTENAAEEPVNFDDFWAEFDEVEGKPQKSNKLEKDTNLVNSDTNEAVDDFWGDDNCEGVPDRAVKEKVLTENTSDIWAGEEDQELSEAMQINEEEGEIDIWADRENDLPPVVEKVFDVTKLSEGEKKTEEKEESDFWAGRENRKLSETRQITEEEGESDIWADRENDLPPAVEKVFDVTELSDVKNKTEEKEETYFMTNRSDGLPSVGGLPDKEPSETVQASGRESEEKSNDFVLEHSEKESNQDEGEIRSRRSETRERSDDTRGGSVLDESGSDGKDQSRSSLHEEQDFKSAYSQEGRRDDESETVESFWGDAEDDVPPVCQLKALSKSESEEERVKVEEHEKKEKSGNYEDEGENVNDELRDEISGENGSEVSDSTSGSASASTSDESQTNEFETSALEAKETSTKSDGSCPKKNITQEVQTKTEETEESGTEDETSTETDSPAKSQTETSEKQGEETSAEPEKEADKEVKEAHRRSFAKALQEIEAPTRKRSVLLPDSRERAAREEAPPPPPPPPRPRCVSDSSTDGEAGNDDGIIDFLGKENDRAEARLAARRQARVEAREIRMRELERLQKEQEETSDKVLDLHTTPPHLASVRQPSMSPRERPTSTNSYHSSRRSSEDSMEDGLSLRDIRHELKEVEEKFRKAMIANAQLDNEKAASAYQVELLKDKLEDLEEAHSQLSREHRERCREHEALKRAAIKLKEELTACRMYLEERDRLIADYGLIIVGGEVDEKGEATPRALVSNQSAEVLQSAGEGSLDFRLKTLANEKNELADEVRHLKLELEEERNRRRSEQAISNGPVGDEVQQTLNDYRFRLQKAEQDTSTLQATVARLESQVIRYKSAAEESEKAEDELKVEKRKLLREHRESIARIEELETSNSHLQRRMDKLKNAKSTLLKEL